MVRYKAVIKPSARKEIEAVGEKKDRKRLVLQIKSLAENPRPFGCEKLSGHLDRYRIREGNYRYRIVYSIDDQNFLVDIVKVGRRKGVYR